MNFYKLSVVVPVYNTVEYLSETLSCIQKQSIGFANIQVLLINDGSTDCSGEICLSFQEIHPENVQYIEFDKNYGVSHARNTGLKLATGKYITFWDSDDCWSLNAMEAAYNFLEEHEREIDMVSSNIEFFDYEKGPHILNFELSENRIIDICSDYRKIRSTGSVSVIKTKIAKLYQFDENQSCWEDTKYINQLLLRKKKYGMLSDVIYYYRRRKSNNSVSQTYTRKKEYYLHDLEALFNGLYRESIKQCGECIPMIQYLLAYMLGYRFAEPITILNQNERSFYDEIRRKILLHIQELYLWEITNVDSLIKWKMIAFKHGLDTEEAENHWRKKAWENQSLLERLSRTEANFNVLKQWFVLKQHNKSILTYFEKNHYRRIAIYGMSDLGKYLLEELVGSSIRVVYGIDRRAKKMTFEFPVLTMEDTLPNVDAIIVTAVNYFQELEKVLRKKTVCPVVSLKKILDFIE